MKQYTTAIFPTRGLAEAAIEKLTRDLDIEKDNISYVYRNNEGEIKEVDANDVESNPAAEGATDGAVIGGGVGAALGLATAIGVIPVIGPVLVAGPLVTALGIGGVAGATAAGAVTGAVAGGLIGALVSYGMNEVKAQKYEDLVMKGNILVVVYADNSKDVAGILSEFRASDIETASPE